MATANDFIIKDLCNLCILVFRSSQNNPCNEFVSKELVLFSADLKYHGYARISLIPELTYLLVTYVTSHWWGLNGEQTDELIPAPVQI